MCVCKSIAFELCSDSSKNQYSLPAGREFINITVSEAKKIRFFDLSVADLTLYQ